MQVSRSTALYKTDVEQHPVEMPFDQLNANTCCSKRPVHRNRIIVSIVISSQIEGTSHHRSWEVCAAWLLKTMCYLALLCIWSSYGHHSYFYMQIVSVRLTQTQDLWSSISCFALGVINYDCHSFVFLLENWWYECQTVLLHRRSLVFIILNSPPLCNTYLCGGSHQSIQCGAKTYQLGRTELKNCWVDTQTYAPLGMGVTLVQPSVFSSTLN